MLYFCLVCTMLCTAISIHFLKSMLYLDFSLSRKSLLLKSTLHTPPQKFLLSATTNVHMTLIFKLYCLMQWWKRMISWKAEKWELQHSGLQWYTPLARPKEQCSYLKQRAWTNGHLQFRNTCCAVSYHDLLRLAQQSISLPRLTYNHYNTL